MMKILRKIIRVLIGCLLFYLSMRLLGMGLTFFFIGAGYLVILLGLHGRLAS